MNDKPRSPWLLQPRPLSAAKLRLFCFPFAGGGASTYFKWCEDLERSGIEVCSVQLPGRDTRFAEPFETNILQVAGKLASELYMFSDKPFALFGHSMGSLLAFETARALRNTYGVEPAHLFVSGRVAPHMAFEKWWLGRQLSSNEFINELCAQYGPIPSVILEDDEILEIYIKRIRSDLSMLDAYRCISDHALSCPISAFSGAQDLQVHRSGLDAWRDMTTGMFFSGIMPGGHFFIDTSRAEIVGMIAKMTDF